ncbi:MAG TPA: glycosyltransferase family 4 protein [Alphaproteobacteria bacterium]
MRLLYINPDLARPRSLPGLRGARLVADLRALGVEVETYPEIARAEAGEAAGPERGLKHLLKRRLPQRWSLRLLDLSLALKGTRRTLSGAAAIWRGLRAGPPDLVLARTMDYDRTPWLAAALLGRPLVLELHHIGSYERLQRGRAASRLAEATERAGWRRAAALWVISQELARLIVSLGAEREKVHCIPWGIEDPPHGAWQPRPGDDPVRVVFAGSFYPWHGIEVLLEAFSRAVRQAPNLHLSVIGDGLSRAENERRARELGIADRIEFTGWLQHGALARRLRQSHVGVAPFLPADPFYMRPVKILDYMSAGMAIVASGQGEVERMLEHGRTGWLVTPGDPASLADALVRLARDRDLREALGRAAQTEAARLGTPMDTARRVLDLCREVVPEQAARMTPAVGQGAGE